MADVELSFEIPATPENKKAMEDLEKMLMDGPDTLYVQDENGNIFPVMRLTKHPDCPDGWYDYVLKRFLNYKEDRK